MERRRRKIKCLFQADKNGACNECYARGVSCVDQESAAEAQTLETRQSLRERVANLESLIKVIATKVDLDDLTTSVPAAAASVATSTEHTVVVSAPPDLVPGEGVFDRAPIMSLFNNSITTFATVPQSEPASAQANASSEEAKLREKLLAYLPSENDVQAVFKKCTHWWNVWGRTFPELRYTTVDAATKFFHKNTHSESILSLSKAILCLCLGLQQIDANFVKARLKLPLPRGDLIQYYLSTIHDNVFSDDRYLLKTEGLEIAVLLAKIDANAGRPRKAWLTYRRAISFALLLGYNRKTTWQVTSADSTSGPKRRAIFWALFSGDRYFSLVLGLPYSLTDQQCDIISVTESMELPTIGPKMMDELSNLGGRLIERYQDPELVSLETTMKLDRQLQELKKHLPSLDQLNPHDPSISFEDIYDRAIIVTYFNYIRALLHLPFMLKGWDSTFDHNRKITLESSREMLQAYVCLRTSLDGDYINCRIIDFQIFLVCLVIIINSIAFEPFVATRSASDALQLEKDWELVLDVKKLLESAEKGSTGSAIAQDSAIETLDLLLDCRNRCPDEEKDFKQISIPYFGTITIQPRDEVRAALIQKLQCPPSTTTLSSSCGSPASSQQSWQLPTPPASLTLDSHNKPSPYIAFDRDHIPMPSAYNLDNALEGNNGDFEFNNSIYMNDMVGSYDWLSMPVAFDTDPNGWLVNNNQQPSGSTGRGGGAPF
ncbi:MAG: hypothetical protein GOMPHAMPRED_002629 [Gomphillus americanus]|uniref:Xylanolytic transcriptional activator regulatory domain-containing protein n=1 Tax=Gomphillus americanus TaxID=1940652 RepID=A0A8H3IQV4_9LECA|nr:MAG: hypothetical protein GOMPHAMPRED_002629 [Gomphillus americanus]